MKPSTQFKQRRKPSGLFIPLILVCFALSQSAHGVVPPPDGGYPNFTTAEGTKALQSLTTGFGNTAVGWSSLFSNAEGSFNTATGAGALLFNTVDENTAFGAASLLFNTTGLGNTAVGAAALLNNVDGNDNTAVGFDAGQNLTNGFENIYIGDTAGTLDFTGASPGDEAGVIRIGSVFSGTAACFINGIATNSQVWNGVTVCQVTVNGSGQLGVDCVNPNNPNATPASPHAPVPRSGPQQPATRPQRQAMLNGKVEKLQATVAQQQKQIETLTAQLKEQAGQIQRVSAEIEASKPTPQVVNNNQ